MEILVSACDKINFKKYFYFIVGLAIPLGLVFFWFYLNKRYPMYDAADYFNRAFKIYQIYKTEGLISSTIFVLFKEIGFAPISFPSLSALFFIMGQGHIFESTSLALLFFFSVILIYIYKISNVYLSPSLSALVTIFIGTTPWLLEFTYQFMSEIALMAVSSAIVFYLIKINYFVERKYSIPLGISIGLALTIRPIEFIFSFIIILVFYMYLAIKRKSISSTDLISCAIIMFLHVVLLTISLKNGISLVYLYITLIVIHITIILAYYYLTQKTKLHINFSFVISITTTFFVCCFWWLPRIPTFYKWIYQTSFGPMAELITGEGIRGISLLQSLYIITAKLGGLPLFVIMLILIISFVFTYEKREELCELYYLPLISLTMIIPFSILQLFAKASLGIYRRHLTGFLFILLSSFIFAIHSKMKFKNLRIIILCLICLLQIFVVFSYTFLEVPQKKIMKKLFKVIDRSIPLRTEDPNEQTLKFIFNNSINFPQNSTFLVHDLSGLVNFTTMKLASLANNYGYNFGLLWEFRDLTSGYNLMNKSDYIIVEGPLSIINGDYKDASPKDRLAVDIFRRWQFSLLEGINLKAVTYLIIKNNIIVIFKINKNIKVYNMEMTENTQRNLNKWEENKKILGMIDIH